MKKHTSRTLLRIGKAKITQEQLNKQVNRLIRPLQLALGLKPAKKTDSKSTD